MSPWGIWRRIALARDAYSRWRLSGRLESYQRSRQGAWEGHEETGEPTGRLGNMPGRRKGTAVQASVEGTYKGVERLVDFVTKSDGSCRTAAGPGRRLMDGGVETGIALMGAVGQSSCSWAIACAR